MNRSLFSSNKMFGFLAIGLTLVSVFIYRNYIMPTESKPNIIIPIAPPVSLLEKQKEKAAIRGINWLINNSEAIVPSSAAIQLMYFYKTTADEKLANELSKIIKEKGQKVVKIETSIDINNKKFLNWNNLQPVVWELLDRKCLGEEYFIDAKRVKELIDNNSKEIFPENMIFANKLVAAYLLKELGIDQENYYVSVLSKIRSQKTPEIFSAQYITSLYAWTHIIFTQSGYFVRYLDAQKYRDEISVFNSTVKAFDSKELNDQSADILSEILISLKLLKVASDKNTGKIYQKLIALQNSDGSWGKGEKTDSVKIHHTVVATLALMEFAPELRKTKAYCPSKPLAFKYGI